MIYSDSLRRLINILNHEFSNSPVDRELFSSLSAKEWTDLYDLASQQGVLAISYNVLLNNGIETLPPREIKIKWALSAENIEKRYDSQQKAASKLANSFSEHGIKMLVFKGLALSYLYPVPSHREFGDIDISLFGDYEKGNEIVKGWGIYVDEHHPKHSVFTYDSVMVENHCTFTNDDNKYERIVEGALEKFIQGAALTDHGYYIPSSEFSILFVLRHSARHFYTSGIALRHLLDWGVLLEKSYPESDLQAIRKSVLDAGLTKFWDVSTAVAGILMGREFKDHMIGKVTERDINLMVRSVIEDGASDISNKDSSELTFSEKAGRIIISRKKFSLIPEGFLKDRILPAISRFAKRVFR